MAEAHSAAAMVAVMAARVVGRARSEWCDYSMLYRWLARGPPSASRSRRNRGLDRTRRKSTRYRHRRKCRRSPCSNHPGKGIRAPVVAAAEQLVLAVAIRRRSWRRKDCKKEEGRRVPLPGTRSLHPRPSKTSKSQTNRHSRMPTMGQVRHRLCNQFLDWCTRTLLGRQTQSLAVAKAEPPRRPAATRPPRRGR